MDVISKVREFLSDSERAPRVIINTSVAAMAVGMVVTAFAYFFLK